MKTGLKILVFIISLISCCVLHSQDTLEEIVTWELDEGVQFRCKNPNSDGSDLNNDGYDDFIHWNPGDPYTFQFFMGNSTPNTTFDFEIEVPFGSGSISWGGDLNGDGFKDIVYQVCTNEFDPGDVYICFGGEYIDLEPEIILYGEDYVPDTYGLNYKGLNGGYDFNGDGYDDLLTGGEGPSYNWNGLIQIFLGGEVLNSIPDFQIQGDILDEFGKYHAVGDINGDGFDDLISSRNETMSGPVFLEVYLGGETIDTISDFVTSEVFDGGASLFSKGDLNNDSYDDILISHSGISLGNQNGVLFLNYQLTGHFRGYININNDEYQDVLYYNTETWMLNILYGSNDFETNSDIIQNTNGNYCNIGDFNNDGEDEILINDCEYPQSTNSATMYGLPGGNNEINYEIEIRNYKLQNFPNPFNPVTTISYDLPSTFAEPVIEIFNIKGERIKTFNCQNQVPIIWDGTDNYRNQVSSGVYLYRIKSDEGVLMSKKMLLLR